MKDKRTRLTARELEAIEEALTSRLAGERDNQDEPDSPRTEDYEAALGKVQDMLANRQRISSTKASPRTKP